MNVLLIGGGGREHALAWAMHKSPLLDTLFCAPGNPGIAKLGTCTTLDTNDHAAVATFCKDNRIDLVVIGPEAPLVAGLADDLEKANIKCFGPSRYASQLEGSKAFTKQLCDDMNIPTAKYGRFDNAADAKAYVAQNPTPIVVKADGLAAGKGVVIASSQQEAMAAVEACFAGAFGAAGHEVVIEEFLEGEEASFFALVDGNVARPLATAQDHKPVGDGDTGPNTGGMGAYSPAPVMTNALNEQVLREIINPTVDGLKQRGHPFKGVLYAGLMITKDGPKLIEYNVRFGDPECQVLMMRLKSDLLEALLATTNETLPDIKLDWHDETALTVVLAANGYPGTPEKGTRIKGLDQAGAPDTIEVFHAGTKADNDTLVANGGRVLSVTARGTTVSQAQERSYAAIKEIDWPEGFCRSDIGWRAIAREKAST